MGRTWDPDKVKDTGGVPVGMYLCTIEKIEETTTSTDKFCYANEYEVIEPDSHAGQTIKVTHTIGTDSDKMAEEHETWVASDAYNVQKMKKLIVSAGVVPTHQLDENIQEALGRKVLVAVGMRKDETGTEVKGYFKVGDRPIGLATEKVKTVQVAKAAPAAKTAAPAQVAKKVADKPTEAAAPKAAAVKVRECPHCSKSIARDEFLGHLEAHESGALNDAGDPA